MEGKPLHADDAVLEMRDLHVGYYRDLNILQGLNVIARRNRITTVLGANGVGKSTALKAASGFLRPNSGDMDCSKTRSSWTCRRTTGSSRDSPTSRSNRGSSRTCRSRRTSSSAGGPSAATAGRCGRGWRRTTSGHREPAGSCLSRGGPGPKADSPGSEAERGARPIPAGSGRRPRGDGTRPRPQPPRKVAGAETAGPRGRRDQPSRRVRAAGVPSPSGSASAASRSARRLPAGSEAAVQAERQAIVRSKFRTPRSWVSP